MRQQVDLAHDPASEENPTAPSEAFDVLAKRLPSGAYPMLELGPEGAKVYVINENPDAHLGVMRRIAKEVGVTVLRTGDVRYDKPDAKTPDAHGPTGAPHIGKDVRTAADVSSLENAS
jgi:hypothetical protein